MITSDPAFCVAPYFGICDNVGRIRMAGDVVSDEKVTLVMEREADGVRAALMENQKVVSFYFESDSRDIRVGDLYLGKVLGNRLSQVGWFMDLGNGRSGFLPSHKYVSDCAPQAGELRLVQVDKEARDHKEAELTEHVQITGKSIIFLPKSAYVAVSKRIAEGRGERLKTKVSGWCSAGEGAIIRTYAEDQDVDALYEEFSRLKKIWNSIRQQAECETSPKRILRPFSFISAILNENHFPSTCSIVANFDLNEDELPEHTDIRIKNNENPFIALHLEPIYQAALHPFVPLESGASLAIEYTETLTAIDVNSGSMLFQNNCEATAYKINCIAAREIARQLRLRQIGGMIVIDFLRMEEESDRNRLLLELENSTKTDPSAVHVYGYSHLGLLEITRKRQRYGLRDRAVDRLKKNKGFIDR